ncbi:adenylate/guanylate cyclase domain-containing protein [Microvirga subterranea]|uniref:Adenylate cyclase n=1 Tax=Microvirga subterranea TaxID=186651 RepID=A0A370HMZ6_9HYPH|nr:adenylate cyclase [Microvirga subterranea]
MRVREIRLASGLVLGAFLLMHFSNHALGLVSVSAMEQGRQWFNLVWRNPFGTVLLYGSLIVHFLLALVALFRRRTLRMPWREAAQLAFGLSLPFLLIPHVVGTRIEFSLTGRAVGYPDVVRGLWIMAPENGARQAFALIIAWLHACLGLHFWLRTKQWFPAWSLALYTGAVLVPVLALLGFAEAGKEIASNPEAFPLRAETSSGSDALGEIRAFLFGSFALLIGGAFTARGVRSYRTMARRVRITYPGGRVVTIPKGFSVLEGSRMAGLPHQSACGGRGRCSTCRVRVIEGGEAQPAPTAQEVATLKRINAGPDIRLACQLRPTHDLSLIPVLSVGRARSMSLVIGGSASGGRERELAVLFCDLRDFTRLSEHRLPFDTVFILNRYFEVVGQAVERSGGFLDKFIGDGALALFGLTGNAEDASRQAFDAAQRIVEGVEHLNRVYASELDQPLRVVVSLHAGPAVVGEMGYGQAVGLTAVGDTLNAASRLEGLAKEIGAELVISVELARRAGLELAAHERQVVAVRGRAAPIEAWIVYQARDLARASGKA